MLKIRAIARSLRDERRIRRAKLPWRELEAEAARQGCSPVDIFFDRAGRVAAVESTPEGPRITVEELGPGASRRRTRSPS